MFVQLFLVFSLLFFLYKRYVSYPRPKNFPPGPDGWPIIGALMEISKLDPVAHVAMQKLGEIHGPVCGIYLGKKPNIVVNGWEASREVLMRDEFLSRPPLPIIPIVKGESLGIMFANGEFWKGQRRFTMRQLRDCGFGKTSIESVVHEEIAECVSQLKARAAESKDSTASIDDAFGVSLVNILWAVAAGDRFSHSDLKFKNLLNKINAAFRSGSPFANIISDWPFLKHFPVFSAAHQAGVNAQTDLFELLRATIKEHRKSRVAGSPRDFIDMYLNELESAEEKGDANSPFFESQLVQIISDFFGAGAESTSNSVVFGILYMILYPDVQTKLQEELDRVLGGNRLPSFSDKPNLPYAECVMSELLRIANIAPFTVPHTAAQDTQLHGYDVPKGTNLLINLHSVHMEKDYWGDPECFRPERFLDSNGSVIKHERLIPFGLGKRACPGEVLARMTYFLFFTTMVSTFRFEIVPGSPKPSTVPLPGFTVAPQPFKAKLTLRGGN